MLQFRAHSEPWRLREVTSPIDERFRPYYERVRNGDLKALVEFFDEEGWRETDLGSAFYECMGHLATTGRPTHRKIVQKILWRSEKDGLQTTPAKLASFRYWRQELFSRAKQAENWIGQKREELNRAGEQWNREKLWRDYLFADPPDFDSALPAQERKQRETELQDLVEQPKTYSHDFLIRSLRYGKVPKSLFWMLAQTTPKMPLSQTVRKFACQIAGISESSVSRKSLRKN